MIDLIVFLLLLVGSWTDIRTREVPDWLSYFGIALGFGLRLIDSILKSDFSIVVSGVYGFALFAALGYLMFYSRQWGGGDTMVLMAVGSLLGFSPVLSDPLVAFVINGVITGAVYGIAWTVFLTVKNFGKVVKTFHRVASEPLLLTVRLLILVFLGLIGVMLWVLPNSAPLVLLGVLMILLYYVGLLVRSVELACMQRWVSPLRVTEGDWVVRSVFDGKKEVCGPKDYGVELHQLKKLRRLYSVGKVKRVFIKEGMPFIPNFLFAYLVTFFFGNVVLLIA